MTCERFYFKRDFDGDDDFDEDDDARSRGASETTIDDDALLIAI